MTVILLGNDSTSRGTYTGAGYTYLEKNYPASGSGEITTVFARVSACTALYVGMFRHLGNDIYACISAANLGPQAGGVVNVTDLHLACLEGDVLGVCAVGGSIDEVTTGGVQGYRMSGNACSPNNYYTASAYQSPFLSVGGSGTTVAEGPADGDIYALLEEVKDNYLPTVRQWIVDNVGYLSFFDYMMGCFAYAALNAGAPGPLYAGPTLQQIKDVLGTPQENTLADGQVAILTSFSSQHTEQNALLQTIADDLADPLGHLAIAEGNIETQLTVFENRLTATDTIFLQDILTAVEAVTVPEGIALTTDVNNAVSTLTGEVEEAAGVVNAHTDSAIAALAFATPADVTAAHATTDAAIAALNNLSEAAVSGLVQAAVTTLTGEVDEAVNVLSGLIDAIDPGGDVRYPGYDLTTRGTTVRVTSQGTVSATTHGVAGKMEGVLLSMVSVPSRCTEKVVQTISNYRYPGWIVFADSQGNCDEPQWCNIDARVYAPKLIREPAFCICGFADGVVADVTPWIVT